MKWVGGLHASLVVWHKTVLLAIVGEQKIMKYAFVPDARMDLRFEKNCNKCDVYVYLNDLELLIF